MQEDSGKMAATVKGKLTQENATAATQKVREGVSSLFGGISKALIIAPDDDYQLAKIVDGKAVVFDRYQARLHAIQTNPATYTNDPTPADNYQTWLPMFDIEAHKGGISELLVSNVEIRALYTQLVPLSVSNLDFWSRYYFRCHQLDEEEARRVELMKRADIVQREADIEWDEDDDEDWSSLPTGAGGGNQVPADTANHTLVVTVNTVQTTNVTSVPECSAAPAQLSTVTDDDTTRCNTGRGSDITIDISQSAEAPTTGNTTSTVTDSLVTGECTVETIDGKVSELVADVDHPACVVPVAAMAHASGDDGSANHGTDQDSVSSDNTKSDSLVVVATSPERTSPSEENSSNAKESLDEDWEKDFDVEVTEQELEAVKERLKNSAAIDPAQANEKAGDDWEDW